MRISVNVVQAAQMERFARGPDTKRIAESSKSVILSTKYFRGWRGLDRALTMLLGLIKSFIARNVYVSSNLGLLNITDTHCNR